MLGIYCTRSIKEAISRFLFLMQVDSVVAVDMGWNDVVKYWTMKEKNKKPGFRQYKDEQICFLVPSNWKVKRSKNLVEYCLESKNQKNPMWILIFTSFDQLVYEKDKSAQSDHLYEVSFYSHVMLGKHLCSYSRCVSKQTGSQRFGIHIFDPFYSLLTMYLPSGVELNECEWFYDSLEFYPPATPLKSVFDGENKGGMRTRNKALLAKTLGSLPESLRYLRNPILAIADEDQDMLNTGDIDMEALAQAIEHQASIQPRGFATAHAQDLEHWLTNKEKKRVSAVWAAPIFFAIGVLKGYDLYLNAE